MKIIRISLIFAFLFAVLFSAEKFVPTVSATTDNSSMEKTKKFREEFGLNRDANYISDVMSSKGVDQSFGVALTKEEAISLNNRIDNQNDLVPRLYEDLLENDEAFSGLYVNQQEGGVVYILLSEQLNDNTQRENKLKKIHGDKIKVKYKNVKYSYKTLEEYHQKVNDMLIEKKVNFLSSIEVRENKIKIQIENLNQSDIDSINGILPSDSFEIKEMEANNKDENRDAQQRPLQGGLALEANDGTNFCSSGFIASDSSSNYYLVTAAHCAYTNTWYQGGGYIGESSSHYKRGGNTDARAIKLSNALHRGYYVYHDVSNGRRLESYSTLTSMSYVGQAVCKSGYKTGTTCGTVENLSESGTWDGISYTMLKRASYTSDGGDSGGTVYSGTKLLGVHKGKNANGRAVYSEVYYIARDLGLTPYVY